MYAIRSYYEAPAEMHITLDTGLLTDDGIHLGACTFRFFVMSQHNAYSLVRARDQASHTPVRQAADCLYPRA